jgi:hypothetical protein
LKTQFKLRATVAIPWEQYSIFNGRLLGAQAMSDRLLASSPHPGLFFLVYQVAAPSNKSLAGRQHSGAGVVLFTMLPPAPSHLTYPRAYTHHDNRHLAYFGSLAPSRTSAPTPYAPWSHTSQQHAAQYAYDLAQGTADVVSSPQI